MEWLILPAILLAGSAVVAVVRTWRAGRRMRGGKSPAQMTHGSPEDMERTMEMARDWVSGRDMTLAILQGATTPGMKENHATRLDRYDGDPGRGWPELMQMYWQLNRMENSKRSKILLLQASGTGGDWLYREWLAMPEHERYLQLKQDMGW